MALRGYAVGAVDYLTKPFDPWVLRAKVSVFVELWVKTRQLAAQSDVVREREPWRVLTDAVDEAATLLRVEDDPEARQRALDILEQARWGNTA